MVEESELVEGVMLAGLGWPGLFELGQCGPKLLVGRMAMVQ